MKDRRKTHRRYMLYYTRVYNAKTHEHIGNLIDITPTGIMIVSEIIIPAETILRLQVELTEDVADKPYLEFAARSKWCQPDINPHARNIGFEILDLTAEDTEIIQRVVKSYGFRDNKPGR